MEAFETIHRNALSWDEIRVNIKIYADILGKLNFLTSFITSDGACTERLVQTF